MSRRISSPKLDSKAARARLQARGKPYWVTVEHGTHLGYRRPRGRRGQPGGSGMWVFRIYAGGGAYRTETFAIADDVSDADGKHILTYWQAVDAVRARPRTLAPDAPVSATAVLTVRSVCESYIRHLEGHAKTAGDAKCRLESLVYPTLGDIPAEALTYDIVAKWQAALIASQARVRTAAGVAQRYREKNGDEANRIRQRKSTANRTWAILRAALNRAVDNDGLTNVAWRKLKPFKNVEVARVRFLSIEESKRLIIGCDPEFRPVVQAALATGCRYGELAALKVRDLDAKAGTIFIERPKNGKSRHVHLTVEGKALFERLAAGRDGNEHMLRHENGEPWRKSNQNEFMVRACERAGITPCIGLHVLRHTYASHCAMAGMPMINLARALGHSSTKVTEKNYAHLSLSHQSEMIRDKAPVFGFGGER